MTRTDVLVSSAGRRVALVRAFQDALRHLEIDGRVLTADASRLSAAAHLADGSFVVPRCTDPRFIPAVLELCEARAIGLVVPTIDTELPMYAAARDTFAAAGVTVVVSSPDVVAIGADKHSTHEWMRRSGLPTVTQVSPEEALAAGWKPPFVIKPRAGSASEGVRIVRADGDAELARGNGTELIVQSLAEGDEYTIDVLTSRTGEYVCAVPRRRIEVRGGEVSKGVTERRPELVELAQHVVDALPGPAGPLTIQAFRDPETAAVTMIELNPRFGGGFPLACEAGADFPRWILEELHGLPSSARDSAWQSGLAMLRYDDAVFVDARSVGL